MKIRRKYKIENQKWRIKEKIKSESWKQNLIIFKIKIIKE